MNRIVLIALLIIFTVSLSFAFELAVECQHPVRVYSKVTSTHAGCLSCREWICKTCGHRGSDCINLCAQFNGNSEYEELVKKFHGENK